MIDFLTHYYSTDVGPFRTLSALPDAEAIAVMERLCDDSLYGSRFRNPAAYLHDRRDTEQWVRAEFIAKGGRPRDSYPISMVLGSSRWLAEASPDRDKHGEIRVPLSALAEGDVSFTYPDSMISRWLGRDRPVEFYQPDLHGIVFTLPEILTIVERRGMPEERWASSLFPTFAPYIEAQVWNHATVVTYAERLGDSNRSR